MSDVSWPGLMDLVIEADVPENALDVVLVGSILQAIRSRRMANTE